jgi:hypothetical protein
MEGDGLASYGHHCWNQLSKTELLRQRQGGGRFRESDWHRGRCLGSSSDVKESLDKPIAADRFQLEDSVFSSMACPRIHHVHLHPTVIQPLYVTDGFPVRIKRGRIAETTAERLPGIVNAMRPDQLFQVFRVDRRDVAPCAVGEGVSFGELSGSAESDNARCGLALSRIWRPLELLFPLRIQGSHD